MYNTVAEMKQAVKMFTVSQETKSGKVVEFNLIDGTYQWTEWVEEFDEVLSPVDKFRKVVSVADEVPADVNTLTDVVKALTGEVIARGKVVKKGGRLDDGDFMELHIVTDKGNLLLSGVMSD